ncbi:MAG: FecR family protein [Deltaproteobacteria bacterium]|nr:FecR family protein [Deltaproteobacteria bacterium]
MYKKGIVILSVIFLMLSVNLSAQDNLIGEITWVEGTAQISYPAKSPEDIKIGMGITANATISTGEKSKVVIRLIDQSIVSIAPKTRILIETLVKSQDIREASILTFVGRIRAFIKKQMGNKSKFEFKSKTAIAGVRGTHLAIDVASDGTTKIYLINGFVGVYNRDKMDLPEIMLSEGTFTEVKEGEAPSPPQFIPPEVLREIYQDTSILAMLKSELNRAIVSKAEILPETKTISTTLEEKLVVAIRDSARDDLHDQTSYSQSLTEPLREQEVQGVVAPMDFSGGVHERKVNLNIHVNTNNY